MKSFLIDQDIMVANWAFSTFNFHPVPFCLAVGVVDKDRLVGACLFHAHNGPDVEVSFYGPGVLDLNVCRGLARIAISRLGVSRITARTSRANKMMTRGIKKVGFEFEGIRKFGYGDTDAVMYGLYGKNLARLAGKALH